MDIKKHLFCLGTALWIAAMTTVPPAWSAEKSRVMSMDEYIQATLENSPQAAAIMADNRRREADAVEAGQLNNPDLKIDVTAATNNAGHQVNVELEQPLRGSDFGIRRSYASAIRSENNLENKARLLDLSHDAARAYMNLWLVLEGMAVIDRVTADAKQYAKVVKDASVQGLADKAEADIFSTEATELELQKSALVAEKQTLINAFSRLAGISAGDYRLAAPAVRKLSSSSAEFVRMADNEASVRSLLSA